MARNKKPRQSKPRNRKKSKGRSGINDPLKQLSGKQIRKLAAALTRAETKPIIKAEKRHVKSLRREQNREVGDIRRHTQDVSSNVASFYKSLWDDAQKSMGHMAALGQRTDANVAAGGAATQGALGQIGAEGAQFSDQQNAQRVMGPGGARAQLQEMIALQQQTAAASNQSARDTLASQRAGWQGLYGVMAQAAQGQGARYQADLANRSIQAESEARSRYADPIAEAKARIAETRAMKGTTKAQRMLDLRQQEREYALSQQAVGFDYAKLRADQQEAAASRRNARRLKQMDIQASKAADQIAHERRKELERLDQEGQLNLAAFNAAVKDSAGKTKWGSISDKDRKNALQVAQATINSKKFKWNQIYNKRKFNAMVRDLSLTDEAGSLGSGVLALAFKEVIDKLNKKYTKKGSKVKGPPLPTPK